VKNGVVIGAGKIGATVAGLLASGSHADRSANPRLCAIAGGRRPQTFKAEKAVPQTS
jgi:saccharopine dehydrogenase-like NADP-dependent oxidoreductase